MLGMLQLLTRHQYIEELAGVPQEAQEMARENKERDKEKIGGESRKTSAPDACFKAALKAALCEGMTPFRCRN